MSHPVKVSLCAVALAGLLACGGQTSTPAAPSAAPSPTPQPGTANCSATSVNLTPLSDLMSGTYKGEPGGLYPGRTNSHPNYDAGLKVAEGIGPRDATGTPDPDGRYAFVSIGMSNTTMEFSVFKPMADQEPGKHPRLAIVDGAQGGQTAAIWSSRPFTDVPWSVLDARLAQAGVTAQQVAVVWLKQADASPTSGWPAYAQTLKNEIVVMLQMLKQHFPNLQIAYLSSRIYAGYASSTLNPEPYAYESAFSVRWVIEEQMRGSPSLNYDPKSGTVNAPWVSWGPYLWTDGTKPRSDGLTWSCSDVRNNDGTHPSDSGSQKVAQMLLDFIRTDATARAWFFGG
jgi:hypothetical protein